MKNNDQQNGYSHEIANGIRENGERKRKRVNHSDAGVKTIQEIALLDGAETDHWIDWSSIRVVIPGTKSILHMRIDSDILEFFRSQGKGYQSKINAILRSYVEQYRDN
ncbi:MAG: hypothetical protein HGB36_11530 [Chlorobiaceae bacterium]|nr:hypothetical protein [Chlorobiaceae bacterium]